MKKKFINGLLMAALFVGFTSSMVSCKDYDDEKFVTLEGILSDNIDALQKAIDAQKADLQKQIDDLAALQKQCKADCEKKQKELQDQIDLCLLKTEFLTELANLKVELDGKYYTQTVLDQKFQEINAKFDNYYTIDQIKVLFADYYTKSEIDTELGKIRADLENYLTKDAVASTIITLIGRTEATLTDALDAYIADYNKKNGIIDETAIRAILAEELLTMNNAINAASKLAGEAKDLAEANGIEIGKLKTTVETLDGTVKTISNKITEVETTANNAWAKAQANETLITNLRNDYNNLETTVNTLSTTVSNNYTELKNLIEANKTKLGELEATVKANKEAADALFLELNNALSSLQGTVGTMQTTLGTVETNVGALQTKAEELNTAIEQTNSDIEALIKKYDNIIAKFISGIVINGTYNPLYGQMALPFDVRSNMLVVFHGITDDLGLEFPTPNTIYSALPGELYNNFTAEDLKILGYENPYTDYKKIPGYIKIGENQRFVAKSFVNDDEELEGAAGNAGTLYLTVNPTDRDFTGTQFTLINSANVEVPVQLSDLAKSDHVLSYGITRAGVGEEQSPNGFYETQVTVQADALDQIGMRLDLGGVKDIISDLRNGGAFSVSNVMNTIYSNISDVLDATAVKATWTDEAGTKSVVSQYALGVTGIKPLSFGLDVDINEEFVKPTMARVEDFIHNMVEYCFLALPDFLDQDRFEIGNFELDDLTNFIATFRLNLSPRFIVSSGPKTVSITIPTFTLTGTKGEKVVVKNSSPNVTVKIANDEGTSTAYIQIKVYIGDVIRWMGKYDSEPEENIKDQLKDFLNDVNNFVSEITDINFDSATDKISNKIYSYVEKAYNKVKRFLNLNRFLQPIIVVKTTEGIARLSEVENYPTTAKGTITTLIPTTYNAEILSPAFKKFVAVTNVSKDGASAKNNSAACLNVLKKMNEAEGFNQVLDGGYDTQLTFAPEAGYTYEILYSAVDYFGKIVSKKFYVRVN